MSLVQVDDDAKDAKGLIEVTLHAVDGGKQVRDAVGAPQLALTDDEDTVGSGEAVDGELVESGRAVDEDEVVPSGDLSELFAETVFATRAALDEFVADQAQSGAHSRGDVETVPDTGDDDVTEPVGGAGADRVGERHLVLGQGFLRDDAGEIPLRVEVNDEDPFAGDHGGARQVEDRGGLPDAPLLVAYGDDAHPLVLLRRGADRP